MEDGVKLVSVLPDRCPETDFGDFDAPRYPHPPTTLTKKEERCGLRRPRGGFGRSGSAILRLLLGRYRGQVKDTGGISHDMIDRSSRTPTRHYEK